MTLSAFKTLLFIVLFLNVIPILGRILVLVQKVLNRETLPLRTSLFAGKIEYFLGPIRDRLFPVLFIGSFCYVLIFEYAKLSSEHEVLVYTSVYLFIFLLFSFFNNKRRTQIRLKMTELARLHGNIHPQDFFNQYYRMLGLGSTLLPASGFRLLEWENADFRSGEKAKLVFWPMISAALSTNTLARLAILAFRKNRNPKIGRDCFDGLARIWSTRLTQVFKCRLFAQGMEKIPVLQGRTLVILNHNSYLDFVLNFFAMGKVGVGPIQEESEQRSRQLRLRFIAAKDHFVDNPVIYSWISLGKVIENAGMILVNRRKKGEGWKAMQEAARKLVESDVEVAVYPQGTRAHLLRTSQGKRWDSGYYTSFNAKSKKLSSHLKPGTAHLILDSLIQLRDKGHSHLNVLAAGIIGAGTVAPKGSIRLRSQSEICFNAAPLWQISTEFVAGIKIPQDKTAQNPAEELYFQKANELQDLIDEKLVEALQWHDRLLDFLISEMQAMKFLLVDREMIQHFCQNAKKTEQKLIFMSLERILCLEKSLRKHYINQFIQWTQGKQEVHVWKQRVEELSQKMIHS